TPSDLSMHPLHDALPIYEPTSIDISATSGIEFLSAAVIKCGGFVATTPGIHSPSRLRIFTLKAGILYFTQPPSGTNLINPFGRTDRKSTRLNSSHVSISY